MDNHAEFYSDIITTAVEGGIGYWSQCDEYRWQDRAPEDIYAVVRELAPDGSYVPETDPALRIDWQVIRKGLHMIVNREVPVRRDIFEAIQGGYDEWDAAEIDSEAADCIVQAALLGELRYG